MKYTKAQFLLAAEIGEVSMIDAKHVVSLLDEAVDLEREQKLHKVCSIEECKCIKYIDGDKWYTYGCKIHTE